MCIITKILLGLWWQLFMVKNCSRSAWRTVQFNLWLVSFWFDKLVLVVVCALV